MSKLHKEIDNCNQENSVYLSYEKRWVAFLQVCAPFVLFQHTVFFLYNGLNLKLGEYKTKAFYLQVPHKILIMSSI